MASRRQDQALDKVQQLFGHAEVAHMRSYLQVSQKKLCDCSPLSYRPDYMRYHLAWHQQCLWSRCNDYSLQNMTAKKSKKYTTAFINTDAISNEDFSHHDAWIRSQVVVTSGDEFYQSELDRIAVGATVYVYANGVGVVAAGTVLDEHSVAVTDPASRVSPEPVEYQRKISWFADIARNPVPYATVIKLCGTPSRAVRSIVKGREALRDVVVVHARATATR